MFLSLNVTILTAGSFYTVYKFTKYQCHCHLHDPNATTAASTAALRTFALPKFWIEGHSN